MKVLPRFSTFTIVFLMLVGFQSCRVKQRTTTLYNITKSVESDSAMVVTAHPLASTIGLEILKKGGNAVDAAIGIQFALAVCYPGAGNIGGGGFMLYRGANGENSSLDFREKAPALATRDMYLDDMGNALTDKSQFGHLAAGVPGTVHGMVTAFNKYSKLKNWKMLIQPSIDLATNGYKITSHEANNLNEDQANFVKYNLHKTAFHKVKWQEGDLLVQPELATTLIAIRDYQINGFYKGRVAQLIVDEMKSGGGIVSLSDLANYSAQWRKPIVSSYRGHAIISMPPPSSGGICLAQLLNIVESYNLTEMGFQSPAHVHLIAEAERRVFADRAKYMGDPDFYRVPMDMLMDQKYIKNRMNDFNPTHASKSTNITHGAPQSEETTHFSIVDPMGNAVSLTTTLNGGYGAFTVVKGAGFILNNEMDDFSVKPGVPNLYGLVGSEANKIEPNKRMLSSMTPTIIEKDGQLKMVLGTPGGSTIITSVFQTIVNVLDFGMGIQDAVQAPRFHHQWLPDQISHESGAISPEARIELTKKGHILVSRGNIGRVEAIIADKGKLIGAADKRGDDDAKGF
jgi:gamma-glutamyltranspeptidase / glutathione hydrolase